MDILIPDSAIIEKVARSLVVYVFLLVASRVAGKRQLGQLTAFDLVVLLIISNGLQNVASGLLSAFVIIAVSCLVAWGHVPTQAAPTSGRERPDRPRQARPRPSRDLDCEHMSMAELRAAIRKEGIPTVSEVRYAILEEDGRVSVIPRSVQPA